MATTMYNTYFSIESSAGNIGNHGVACRQTYEVNRHRLFAFCFWMTGNELQAEELMIRVFKNAFAASPAPSAEAVDRAFIWELRRFMRLGKLTLNCEGCGEVLGVRRNVLRVQLEEAIAELPPTERLIFLMHDVESYSHDRIARTMGITEGESKHGLHQARLRVRELLATAITLPLAA